MSSTAATASAEGQRAVFDDAVLQRAARQQLHRDDRHAGDLVAAEDVDRVWMTDRRGELAFAQEPGTFLGSLQPAPQHLQRDAASVSRCSASYTSPIPPRPSSRPIRYGPHGCPSSSRGPPSCAAGPTAAAAIVGSSSTELTVEGLRADREQAGRAESFRRVDPQRPAAARAVPGGACQVFIHGRFAVGNAGSPWRSRSTRVEQNAIVPPRTAARRSTGG